MGGVSEIIRRGRQYNYRLTPKRAGDLTIPAPTAEIDGQTLRGQEMSLVVTAPQDQDIVRMEITAEPQSVYPHAAVHGHPFHRGERIARALRDENPVGVQTSPPELQIPWVDDQRLPDGLQAQTDWRRWLAPLQSSRGAGFAINDIGRDSVFSFFEERRMAFMPESQKIRMADKSGKMTGYRRFQFKRTFIAKKVDVYHLWAGHAERDFCRGR